MFAAAAVCCTTACGGDSGSSTGADAGRRRLLPARLRAEQDRGRGRRGDEPHPGRRRAARPRAELRARSRTSWTPTSSSTWVPGSSRRSRRPSPGRARPRSTRSTGSSSETAARAWTLMSGSTPFGLPRWSSGSERSWDAKHRPGSWPPSCALSMSGIGRGSPTASATSWSRPTTRSATSPTATASRSSRSRASRPRSSPARRTWRWSPTWSRNAA